MYSLVDKTASLKVLMNLTQDRNIEKKPLTGGVGCGNEWRVGVIKVLVPGPVCCVASEVLIRPVTV